MPALAAPRRACDSDGNAVDYRRPVGSEEWVVMGDPDTPVSQQQWEQVMPLLTRPPISEVVMDRMDDAAKYGLKPPKTRVLITTTRGKGSVVEAGWVQPGTHIVAIGTDAKGKQEFDPEIFRHAKTVVDSVLQCSEKGEIQHALRLNILPKDGIHAEIGEVLLGKKPGRTSDEEITIFDSTGMAIQDNTTSHKIYQNALANNVGTFFEFIE